MSADRIYIQPLTLVSAPQGVEGDALRLGGSMAYAREFAVTLVREDVIVQRDVITPAEIEDAFRRLPDAVQAEAELQWSNLSRVHAPMQLGERTIRLDQPQVMGILNVTPDSFSDGGEFMDKPDVAAEHASAMLEAGAAIIDIGGESTRPGAAAVWEGDEIKRVVPMVERCSAMGAAISVDTRRPGVMEAALEAGAHVLNDVSALRHDPRSLDYAASVDAPVILMHAPGPSTENAAELHDGADYANVAFDVFDWLRERRDAAVEAGIAAERIVLDPGVGFGKSLADNLALINALPLFHALGHPLLLGASRKRMIGALGREEPAHERLGGSIALAMKGTDAGYHLLRVHDVAATVQARNVWRGLRDAALTDFGGLPD
ncbi:dihydropteroate synthase [Paraurantiacibacter namhicola]|uniref:dihydropteroate synthase n=1 Tax=Paraurantiacibacter namhicola TaxID=645517 RepID=A0A1C7D7Q2_9SPHN|nr:dihydropteroate synthase [Paraurantiacibacter namhicola]ANU07510.1 Dihydropteroate synthase [Paraurantiacibacter namhicola]